MVKIADNNKKPFYYVSNLITGILTIIDGSCNSIVNNVYVGKRPFKIAVMNNNKVYVACDRSNRIAVVNCQSGEVQTIFIPNNGNIEIDELNHRMFISNTSEIDIYDIDSGKLITNIKGFSGITCLKLNKDSSKLYVLDKLLAEFRIYNTKDAKLIYRIKKVGVNPGYFLISDDDKTAYISLENNEVNIHSNDILKIDIDQKDLTRLSLAKGSVITGLILKGRILYAANKGLNRIELIDIVTYKAYDFILTSIPQPNRLFITDDNTKLLVASRNSGGYGGLDIIDITTNCLIGSVLMDSQNSQPYDVVSVSLILPDTYASNSAKDLHTIKYLKEPLTIITNRIFACYRQNVDFPNIVIRLSDNNTLLYTFKEINFKNGFIVKGSEVRTPIEGRSNFSRIQFIVRITYTIHYFKDDGNMYRFEGFLEKAADVIFSVPEGRVEKEFKLNLEAKTKLIDNPCITGNVISFGVITLMDIKIIGEDQISIPTLQCYSQSPNNKLYLDTIENQNEKFWGFRQSLFPEGTVFPHINEHDDEQSS